MILYKYVPPGRIGILETGMIRFTPPALFNDPFEARPAFPNIDAEISTLLVRKEAIEPWATEASRDAWIREQQLRHFADSTVLDDSAWRIGTLSLSAKRDNVLMWAHYAAQHTGLVIGFDIGHEGWTAWQRRFGPPAGPRKVTYSASRPSRASVGDVTPEDVWYTKSDLWAYEDEWRVTRLVRTASKVLGSGNDAVHLFEFPKESVSEVILGCRASNLLAGEVQMLRSDSAYRDCVLLRAELDRDVFKLNIIPFSEGQIL